LLSLHLRSGPPAQQLVHRLKFYLAPSTVRTLYPALLWLLSVFLLARTSADPSLLSCSHRWTSSQHGHASLPLVHPLFIGCRIVSSARPLAIDPATFRQPCSSHVRHLGPLPSRVVQRATCQPMNQPVGGAVMRGRSSGWGRSRAAAAAPPEPSDGQRWAEGSSPSPPLPLPRQNSSHLGCPC